MLGTTLPTLSAVCFLLAQGLPLLLVGRLLSGLSAVGGQQGEVDPAVERPDSPRLVPQRLGVPEQVRPTFIRAALAAFAGFAVLGLFTAVSPAFLGQGLAVKTRAVVGLVVFAVFAASTAGQVLLKRVDERAAMPAGCAALIGGMGLLAAGLASSSLASFVVGGLIAGCGQGLSFRSGLAL